MPPHSPSSSPSMSSSQPKTINVVLSGGIGSRLWPLSRKKSPKQYLHIFDNQSLFQKTVVRNQSLCDGLLVVGNINNYNLSRKDLSDLNIEQYTEVIEACPRNTAAAIAFAAFAVQPEDVLFVTPSDHLIEDGTEYDTSIQRAIELAKQGYIVTFGIKPTKPETGFGYIEANGENVESFREKPSESAAQEFIDRGNFLWNSGMFCFKAGVFLEELAKLEPEVFSASKRAFDDADNGFLDESKSMEIPSISVDYAVMEKTKTIKVVPSGFPWSDMGSFESVYDYFLKNGYPVDDDGNMVIGTEIPTYFVGLKNSILVNAEDAILVLQKEESQKVKNVYTSLETQKPELL